MVATLILGDIATCFLVSLYLRYGHLGKIVRLESKPNGGYPDTRRYRLDILLFTILEVRSILRKDII